MMIHLVAEDVDEFVTVGGDDADVTVYDALAQIPPRPIEELLPDIRATGNPVLRTVMMYHAVLSYIDDKSLWEAESVVFRLGDGPDGWSVEAR